MIDRYKALIDDNGRCEQAPLYTAIAEVNRVLSGNRTWVWERPFVAENGVWVRHTDPQDPVVDKSYLPKNLDYLQELQLLSGFIITGKLQLVLDRYYHTQRLNGPIQDSLYIRYLFFSNPKVFKFKKLRILFGDLILLKKAQSAKAIYCILPTLACARCNPTWITKKTIQILIKKTSGLKINRNEYAVCPEFLEKEYPQIRKYLIKEFARLGK